MRIDILISGFGGQGIMMLGKIIAYTALEENRFTTWFPSYGAEVRGGTAHCFVKISDKSISSPFIKKADVEIIFNQPSLDKFEERIKRNGLLILNRDLIRREPKRKDIKIITAPLNKLALECGDIRVANTITLGILTSFLNKNFLNKKNILKILKKVFTSEKILEQNLEAFSKGEGIAKEIIEKSNANKRDTLSS
jgi:2-oxoglutarate ferredoxin oxidoreductase subunit gamma